MENIDIKTDQT